MNSQADLTERIVNKMQEKDSFLRWLNPELINTYPGYCHFKVKVREEFLNHVGILHGGITYSIADAAFAYAANTHNRITVALDVTISYPNAGYISDKLNVEATEAYLGDKTAIYRVTVLNQKNELLGIFNGTVYRKKQKYFEEDSNT